MKTAGAWTQRPAKNPPTNCPEPSGATRMLRRRWWEWAREWPLAAGLSHSHTLTHTHSPFSEGGVQVHTSSPSKRQDRGQEGAWSSLSTARPTDPEPALLSSHLLYHFSLSFFSPRVSITSLHVTRARERMHTHTHVCSFPPQQHRGTKTTLFPPHRCVQNPPKQTGTVGALISPFHVNQAVTAASLCVKCTQKDPELKDSLRTGSS